ncbi:MAG: signal peptidase II [Rhodothermales bacterium]
MRTLWIAAVVVVVDQLSKLAVVRLMYNRSIPLLGDWLRLTYTENPGMAFGITFGPRGMVTVFSIIATVLIIVYLVSVRKGYGPYRWSLALILGGAIGNIIDRVFYGVFYGYDGFFTGRVVDFIHVNAWRGFVPDAIPFIGGTYMNLFPIWNVADMAIVLGVVGILVFQGRFHQQAMEQTRREPTEADLSSTDPIPVVAATDPGSVSGRPPSAEAVSTDGTSSAYRPPVEPTLKEHRPSPTSETTEEK